MTGRLRYSFVKEGLAGWVTVHEVQRFQDFIFWQANLDVNEYHRSIHPNCYWMILK